MWNFLFVIRVQANRVMGLAWCPCIYTSNTKQLLVKEKKEM